MPEMRFHVSWPDGQPEACYSPSLVVKDYLSVGETYAIDDFLHRARTALMEASARVAKRYGHPCSLALAQLARLEEAGAPFLSVPDASVRVDRFEE